MKIYLLRIAVLVLVIFLLYISFLIGRNYQMALSETWSRELTGSLLNNIEKIPDYENKMALQDKVLFLHRSSVFYVENSIWKRLGLLPDKQHNVSIKMSEIEPLLQRPEKVSPTN